MTDKSRDPKADSAETAKRKSDAVPRQIHIAPDNDKRLQEAMDHVLREHADVLENLSKR